MDVLLCSVMEIITTGYYVYADLRKCSSRWSFNQCVFVRLDYSSDNFQYERERQLQLLQTQVLDSVEYNQ